MIRGAVTRAVVIAAIVVGGIVWIHIGSAQTPAGSVGSKMTMLLVVQDAGGEERLVERRAEPVNWDFVVRNSPDDSSWNR